MSNFHPAYPDHATASRLDELGATEYSYLDSGGHTYLDFAERTYRDAEPGRDGLAPRLRC